MSVVPTSNPSTQIAGHLKFTGNKAFQVELRRRIDEFFHRTGKRKRDCPQMYAKSGILLASYFGLYVMLVFVAQTWWQALPAAILLGLVTAGIGMNVQHDGGHHGYSSRRWVNKLMSMTLDLIGGSSYIWHHQHGVMHHTYVNISGHDSDIDLGLFGRLSPHQKHRWIHHWQHYYVWPLYGMLAIRWQIWGDYLDVLRGRIGKHRIPRPKGWDLALFIGGKLMFLVLALGVPMIFHPWWVVLVFYGVVSMVAGMTLSIVFQLAHTVEEAEFVAPPEDNHIDNAWAIHQVESTVDFARRSRLAAWLLGGLNFQIEHHLFPRICHIHYPAMSKIVEQTCREFGVKYHEHPTFLAGVASHFRWLRRMGMPGQASEGCAAAG